MRTFAVFLSVLLISCSALAGGGDHYPNGAEDFLVGAAPPPGFYAIDYNYFYSAKDYRDDRGRVIDKGPLADFSLSVYSNVLRFIYVSKLKLLGANYTAHIFLPWVELNANAKGFHVHKKGMGDIIVDPFILTWHGTYLHALLAMDIYVPNGEYDKKRPVNIGKNFWTFEPILALTFLHPSGFSASVKLMYDFNTTNNDWINPKTGRETSLKPGQEFHFDYALGYSPAKWIRLGIAGYFYQQTTDDEIDGKEVEHQRGRAFAVGPAVKVNYKRFMLVVKGLKEFGVRNRPRGRCLWVKLYYTF